MRVNGLAAVITALAITMIAGCKKGDIIERSVATQSGATILGIQPFSVLENSSNKFLFTMSRALKDDVSFTWTVSAIATPTTGRFSAITGSATIPAGSTTVGVPIPLINDSVFEGNVDYTLTLSDAPDEVKVPIPAITFTLVDDELPPVVQFSTSSQSKLEGSGSATVTVTMTTASVYATTVTFSTSGTATRDDDYSITPASNITFLPGETSKDITVTLIDDYIPEPDETAIFTIDAVTAGQATIGATNPHTLTIVNDDFNPVVLNVTSTLPNGIYNSGNIPITMHFSRAVVVTGTPTLQLGTGSTQRLATYASGSGTPDLVFNYAIQSGDSAIDLDYTSNSALALAGGSIKSTGDSLDAMLNLPAPNAAHSLGANKDIAIDTVSPVVTNVTSTTPDGAYGTDSNIIVTVAFSKPVFVTGSPTLLLETGTIDHAATYVSGSGLTTLTFSYTVQAGDASLDLEAQSTSALTTNGGTIQDNANNNAVLTLPAAGATGSLSYNKALVIDTQNPTIAGVTSSLANGNYPAGTVVPIQVVFTERVYVTGTPQLTLETGTTDHAINFTSGSGTSILTFTYTVQAGDTANPLDYISTSALGLNGGTIVDVANNAANLTLKPPGTSGSLGVAKTIVIDTTAPTVSLVTATNADGAYKAGSIIDIQVVMSEPVIVAGTPQLTLETGATDRVVDYTSGSGTQTLVFRYTVQPGDTALDLDYLSSTALALNSGIVADAAGNNADLTLADPSTPGSLGANKNLVIDTTAPTILLVSSAKSNGSYSTGTVIDVQVNFSEIVYVTGTPQLLLKTGPSATTAINYISGSASTQLTFRYTVASGDSTARLDYNATTSFLMNGSTVTDAALNNAQVSLPAPGASGSLGANKNLIIDTSSPSVLNVSSTTADGSYKVGSTIVVTVLFSEVIYVTGTPTIQLATGTTNRNAAYASGSGTNTLRFNYTVQAGDTSADLDYVDTTSLSANGGTIQDLATNSAILTLATPGTAGSLGANKNLVIDTTAPTILSVDSTTASGYYKAGTTIDVIVHFSESVFVTGTPQLTLETGTTKEVASYTSGSGTADLLFRYVVQAGDTANPLDYVSTTALALNGGVIQDLATNAAVLTLNAPGSSGSLSAAKTIVIDTLAPTVTNVTASNADGYYKAGQVISVQVVFSENVFVTGTPQLTMSTNQVVNYSSGSGTSTLTFAYTIQAGDTTSDLDYLSASALALNSGAILDIANNAAVLTLPTPGAAGSLGANKNIVIDTTAPTITNVTSAKADGPYTTGTVIDVTVSFSESVTVTGSPQLVLKTGSSATTSVPYLSGSGGATLTFRYTVAAGDSSADLDYNSTTSFVLNGGSVRDAALNDAVVTLPAPGATGSLGANKNLVIDTTAPSVVSVNSTTSDGSYKAGSLIVLKVFFSENVFVTGSPTLLLRTGAVNETATYVGGSGSGTLTFNYTVQAGDTSARLDYVDTASLGANGGTIVDVANNTAVLTLPTPGATNSLGANRNLVIDTTAPTIVSVDSTVANGSYKAGAIIDVVVHFSETVVVTGTPKITLETGSVKEAVAYTSGTGTANLTFRYTVQAGDTANPLDYVSTTALALNGGTIQDAATNGAVVTLPAPGSTGSLSNTKTIVIDTVAPTVTNVTATNADGSYKAGQIINVRVVFSESVFVTGTPQLTMSTNRVVDYSSGSGTSTLTFAYTIQAGDTTSDLDYLSTTALALNSGTILDLAGNAAVLTLASPGAAGSLGANKDIVIDTTAPTVTNVSSAKTNGSYTTGAVIDVVVTMSEPVTVTGSPRLTLKTGASATTAIPFLSGSGSATLTFRYTVAAGDSSARLDYNSSTAFLLNGATITDAALNNAVLTLAAPGAAGSLGANKNLVIDTIAPTVVSVNSTTADGSYKAGQTIAVTVNFSENVYVTGTPTLLLSTGATNETATYASGSGSSTLTFNYTIQAGDTAARLDYVATTSLALNGGTIQDLATNAGVLTLATPGAAGSLGANRNLVIDTTAPTITSVDSTTANGSYKAGAIIDVVVHFSETVYVTGTPKLTLETGSTKEAVSYTSGSGTANLTFRYTVQAGDVANPLDYVSTSALALNGGTIQDLATNAATLTLASPGTAGSLGNAKTIIIDTTAPTVTNVTASNADGYYKAGQVINIQVVFSETVYVTGTPQLTTSTNRAVNYSSGSGTSTLTFAYTIQSGDNSARLDYLSTTALALNSGTILDNAGNAAVLTLATPSAAGSLGANKNIVIDTTAPTITGVTSAFANGSYTTGTVIDIVVNFSENVTVTGTPQLVLKTGPSATTTLSYLSGSGGNAMTFRYTVAAGDTSADLDYNATTSFSMNGSTIVDGAQNAAVVTLPSPGAAGSLGGNKDIVIDTTAPTVTSVSSTTTNGAYTTGAVIAVTVQFSEVVFVTGTPSLLLSTGTTNRSATYASGSGTTTLRLNYTVQAGDNSSDLDYVATTSLSLGGGTIKDLATNAAVLTLPAPGAANSLGANKNIVIDTTSPTVLSLDSTTADGYYTTAATVDVVVHFSEAVYVTGTPTLTLNTTPTNRVVSYTSGSGSADLVFRYTVQAGDTSARLDTTSTTSLALAGGTIKDNVGNDGTLTLPAPGGTGALGTNRNLVIDTTAPTAPATVDDGTWVTYLTQTPLVSWAAATDATSGIARYELAIGTSSGGTQTLTWTAVGSGTSKTQTGLSLTEGTLYYVSIRAVDRAGNISAVTSGDGFRADVTPPTAPSSMTDGLTSSSLTTTPTLTWTAASDSLSGLAGYQVAIGSTLGGTDTMTWTPVGNILSTTRTLTLVEGNTYYASVRAVDVAGNIGSQTNADGWVIGWLQESYLKGTTSAASFAQGTSVAISGDTMVVGYTGGKGGAFVYVRSGTTWTQQTVLTDGNGQSGDNFGKSVAIDGDTIVIGAPNESSNGTTITTTSALLKFGSSNGAAYIYTRSGTTWSLQAFAKASNGESNDLYGTSVAISGNTVVVGAIGEASNVTGTSTSSSSNNSNAGSGAAYVLTRSGSTWTEQSYLKAATSKAGVKFGSAVAVYSDTAVIGAPADNAPVTGITNGTGGSTATGGTGSGAVYTFLRTGTTWAQQAFIKASNAASNDALGSSVAISGDLVVSGAPAQSSGGSAYVFSRSGVTWSESQILKANNLTSGDTFGSSVSIDGTMLLVGSPNESSAATTVGQMTNSSSDHSAAGAGAAYLYRLSGTWSQLAYLKAPNSGAGDAFGTSVSLSGSSLAVGAPGEDSNLTTITNGQTASANNSTSNSGAAYLFRR